MRIHLIGIPSAQTTKQYALCGFTQATIRFAKVLKELGHIVFLYASEENDAPCDELITTITKEEQQTLLGPIPYQYAAVNNTISLWNLSNSRMIREIAKRKEARDPICTIGGISQKSVTDAHPDLLAVEYSIGYIASYAPYRVYESHVWRHCTQGFQDDQQGRFYDAVIPLFFDPDEFPFRPEKEPFILYVGRLTPRKGIAIACESAKLAGVPLKFIGYGDPSLITYGEYLGALSNEERNEWMARATALIAPTQYLEPFGSIVPEAALTGTPSITTNFGAFVETVEQGMTGYRCDYLGEFVKAIRMAEELDPHYIRARAERLYSIKAVAPQYGAYFERLSQLWDKGWNTL